MLEMEKQIRLDIREVLSYFNIDKEEKDNIIDEVMYVLRDNGIFEELISKKELEDYKNNTLSTIYNIETEYQERIKKIQEEISIYKDKIQKLKDIINNNSDKKILEKKLAIELKKNKILKETLKYVLELI